MNSKKLLLVLFSVLLAQGCNDSQQPDIGQSRASLECLTFQNTAFGIYAMTNWDVDHNGCLNESEAAQVTELPDNAFIWPENCPTTCKDGCYKGSSECFDKSLCNCEYKHFGPSHWGWSCEAYEDECSKFI